MFKRATALVVTVVPAMAFAAVPAYVTTALAEATTKFEEYVGAGAPVFLTSIAGLAGLWLIAKLIKRAMRG